jgi:hypothetical protein
MNETTAATAPAVVDVPTADIEQALAEGRVLKTWWNGVEAGTTSVTRFELVPAFPGGAAVWGFFANATVSGKNVPIMGDVGDYFFDLASVPAAQRGKSAQWMCDQIQEFALHYWLRTQAWAQPLPYPQLDRLQPPALLKGFNLAPPSDPELSGMTNLQRFYKLQAGGATGEFSAADAREIIDLRELESRYDWVTVERLLLDFNLSLAVGGDNSFSLSVPLKTAIHLILSADLIANRRHPRPGVLGEFGAGFALMKRNGNGPLAIGPDKIQPGFQLQTLAVLDTSEVRLRIVTIMARPGGILNLSFNPVLWGEEIAEKATSQVPGLAGSMKQMSASNGAAHLGAHFDPWFGPVRLMSSVGGKGLTSEVSLSWEQIERNILCAEAIGLRNALLGTRAAWMQVPDWLDAGAIPDWVVQGRVV